MRRLSRPASRLGGVIHRTAAPDDVSFASVGTLFGLRIACVFRRDRAPGGRGRGCWSVGSYEARQSLPRPSSRLQRPVRGSYGRAGWCETSSKCTQNERRNGNHQGPGWFAEHFFTPWRIDSGLTGFEPDSSQLHAPWNLGALGICASAGGYRRHKEITRGVARRAVSLPKNESRTQRADASSAASSLATPSMFISTSI